jgi:hypothetical protein
VDLGEDRDPAGAAHRKFGLPERSGAGKGAPLFGAAKRTLAGEHRSGRKDSAMGGRRGIMIMIVILLVGSEQSRN